MASIRWRLSHFPLRRKLLIVFVSAIVALVIPLALTTQRILDGLVSNIEHNGSDILAHQTEKSLISLLRAHSQMLDNQFDEVANQVGYARASLAAFAGLEAGNDEEITNQLDQLRRLLQQGNPTFTRIYLVAQDGRTWIAPPPEKQSVEGREELRRHMFSQTPRNAQTLAWSDVYEDPLASTPVSLVDAIAIVAAPPNSDAAAHGEPWGYLGVSVSLGNILARLNQRALVPGSYSFFLDENAHLVAAPPQARTELASIDAYRPRGPIDLSRTGQQDLDDAIADMTRGSSSVREVTIKGNRKYIAYQPLNAIDWRMGIIVSVSMATAASEQLVAVVEESSRTALVNMFAYAGFFLALTLIIITFLGNRLVAPLQQLTKATRSIVAGRFQERVTVKATDELGELADVFNTMAEHIETLFADLEGRAQELGHANQALESAHKDLEQRVEARTSELRQAQKQLMKAAHEAGRVEVANSVLHNVGNVLNSVNVAIAVIDERLQQSRATRLSDLVALLQRNEDDLGRFIGQDRVGRRIPEYLQKLDEHLRNERTETKKELERLSKHVEHIGHIIRLQQTNAKGADIAEDLAIDRTIEDAVIIAGLHRDKIEIVREFNQLPMIKLEKHRLLQILVNLLTNAKHAVRQHRENHPRIDIRGAMDDDGRIRVAICDNGVGISADTMTQIFQHGFTTRKDGHGFGLHGSAIAARDMGIELTAHSDGLGRGATFTLLIPCAADKADKVGIGDAPQPPHAH